MRKSNRFWWLHGAILLAAAAGCRSSCSHCANGTCGGQGMPPAGPAGTTGGMMGGSSYQGMSPGMSAGSSYAPPAMSSGAGAVH